MVKYKDWLIKVFVYLTLIVVLAIVFRIAYFIIENGINELNIDFLLDNPKGMPLGTEGGIKNAILGSFALMAFAMIFSAILGVSCAMYNVIYCQSKAIHTIISLTVQCISSIPSIILGLFVYGFFIVSLNVPTSLLTASITLGLMVFAFVEIKIEKAIEDVDRQFIKDSHYLGVDNTYMSRKLILPLIKENIITTSILAGSYAIGATAPIMMTGVVYMADSPRSLLKPVMALPFHLHMLLSQAVKVEKAYATALVLIIILIILHVVSELIMRNIGGVIVDYFRAKKS